MADDLVSIARRKVKLYTKDRAAGFISWCAECAVVQSGTDELGTVSVPFKLWPEQRRLAKMLAAERFLIALKGRQIGVTTEILLWYLFQSLYWHGMDFRIVSIIEKEARDALDRIRFAIQHLPEWTRPELEVSNTTTIRIAETGSTIRAMASTQNAGRGTTLSGILIDEAAVQVYCEEILTSALPALERRGGSLIMVSTANGVGNTFERQWRLAEQGTGRFKPVFISWRGDPTRTDTWYSEMVAANGQEFASQEFPNTAQEAFLASGRPFFSQEKLGELLAEAPRGWEDGYLAFGSSGKVEFFRQARGYVRIWRHPIRGKRYVIFSDVAEGLESGDASCAYVLPVGDEPTEEVARVYGRMDPGELADILELLGNYYSYEPLGNYQNETDPALVAVEANNQGILSNDVLRSRGYRRLYYQRNLDTLEPDPSGRAGWLTTGGANGSRKRMLGVLQQGFRLGTQKIVDHELGQEMGNFYHRGPGGKPQAGPGQNDDRVIARAGATYILRFESRPETIMDRFQADESILPTDADYWVKKDLERMLARKRPEGNLEEI